MNDEKIIQWLKGNNPKTKETIYAAFEHISHDVIDYHVKKIFPNLFKDKNMKNRFYFDFSHD